MANVPTILTEGNLQPGQNLPRATPEDFGAGVGDAIQQAGQQGIRSAQLIGQIADIKKNQASTQWVGDSMTQEQNYINKWMADPNNSAKPTYSDDLTSLLKERQDVYEKAAPNAQAKLEFRRQFQEFGVSRLHSAYTTQAENHIVGMQQSISTQTDQMLDSYRAARNIPNVDANGDLLKNIQSVSDNIDKMFGQIAPNMAKNLKDKLMVDSVYGAMEYSPDLAQNILNKSGIEGRTRHTLQDEIDQAFRGKNSADAADFERQVQNHLTMVQEGKSRDKIPLSVFQAHLSRDQANAHWSRVNDLVDTFNGANDFMSKISSWNAGEQSSALNDLKSKIGSNENTAKIDKDIYDLVDDKVAKNIQQIHKDPVAYMVQNNPAIKRISDQMHGLPENASDTQRQQMNQQMLDLVFKYQGAPGGMSQHAVGVDGSSSDDPRMYLNVPRNQVHVQSMQEAEQNAAQVNKGSPKDALATIDKILNQYPEQYRAIAFNDMVSLPGEKGIRGEYWAAAMNKNAPWIDDYIGVIQQASEIKKASNDKVADFDKALDSNNMWKMFENPIASDNFQRQNIVEDFRSGITLYAMGLAQKRGLAPDKAVKTAVEQLLDSESGITSVNGKSVMVTRDQGPGIPYRNDKDIADIGRRLKLALKFVDPKEIRTSDEYGRDLFPALKFVGHDEIRNSALRDAILKNGTFQTTPDGKSTTLYYDDGMNHFEMRDKTGKAFSINLTDLPKFEQYILGMSGYGGAPMIRGLETDPLAPHVTGGPQYRDGTTVPPGQRPIDFVYKSTPYVTNWPSTPSWLRGGSETLPSRTGTNSFTIDGDTIVDEMGIHHRFANINAPEVPHPGYGKTEGELGGLASSNYVYQATQGKQIRIQSSGKKDKYGRILSTIFYKNDKGEEVNLNDELVKKGLAKPFMVGQDK